jgi:hypothetical protein
MRRLDDKPYNTRNGEHTVSHLIERRILVGVVYIFALVCLSVTIPEDAIYAQGTGTQLSISPSTQGVSAGDSFEVDILVDTDTMTRGVEVSVNFDPSLVQVDDVTEGTFYSEGLQPLVVARFRFLFQGLLTM